MSGCLSSSMTGSTDAGPLQPQEDPVPPSTYDLRPLSEGDGSTSARRGCRHHRHQPRRRMTSAPPSGQTIQLTPLWEHVVRVERIKYVERYISYISYFILVFFFFFFSFEKLEHNTLVSFFLDSKF